MRAYTFKRELYLELQVGNVTYLNIFLTFKVNFVQNTNIYANYIFAFRFVRPINSLNF